MNRAALRRSYSGHRLGYHWLDVGQMQRPFTLIRCTPYAMCRYGEHDFILLGSHSIAKFAEFGPCRFVVPVKSFQYIGDRTDFYGHFLPAIFATPYLSGGANRTVTSSRAYLSLIIEWLPSSFATYCTNNCQVDVILLCSFKVVSAIYTGSCSTVGFQ